MPGIRFHSGPGGQLSVPRKENYLLAGGSGGGVSIYNGDIVALTTLTTLTSNVVPVVRPLLAADKAANYLQTAVMAGILGVVNSDVLTNIYGQAVGVPLQGGIANGAGITYGLPGESAGFGPDPATGRSRVNVMLAAQDNYFVGYIGSAVTATHALDNTLAGLTLTVVNGVTTYKIDTAASAAQQCIIIDQVDEADPLYNALGGAVIFRFRASFVQADVGIPYTAQ